MKAEDIKDFQDVCDHMNDLSGGRYMNGKDLTLSLLVTMAMQQAYCKGRWIQDGRDPEKLNWSIVQWETGVAPTPEEQEESESHISRMAGLAVLSSILKNSDR